MYTSAELESCTQDQLEEEILSVDSYMDKLVLFAGANANCHVACETLLSFYSGKPNDIVYMQALTLVGEHSENVLQKTARRLAVHLKYQEAIYALLDRDFAPKEDWVNVANYAEWESMI